MKKQPKKTKAPVKELQWFNKINQLEEPEPWKREGWVGRITFKSYDSGPTGDPDAVPRSYDVVWCQIANGQYQFIAMGGNRITDNLEDIASFERYEGKELGIVKCE